jgi:hypothetical protein
MMVNMVAHRTDSRIKSRLLQAWSVLHLSQLQRLQSPNKVAATKLGSKIAEGHTKCDEMHCG